MAGVAQDVIAVIGRKIPDRVAELKLTDNLRDLGLESIDALEMIFDLEEKFGIVVDADEVLVENFETMTAVAALVESKLEANSAARPA